MAKKNMRNEFEFMASVLDALGVEYEEADIKVRERWRGKVLEGWGVSYIPDDVKQFERWRGKCIEGLSKGGGGSGGFDPSNYEILEFTEDPTVTTGRYICEKTFKEIYDDTNTNYAIYLDTEKFDKLYETQFVKGGYYTLACKSAENVGTTESPVLEYSLTFNLVGYGGEKSLQAVMLHDVGTESEYFVIGNIVH